MMNRCHCDSKWNRFMNIFILTISVSSTYCQGTKGTCDSKKTDEIDKFIYGLNYTKDTVLVYAGGGKTRFIPHEGKLDDQKNFIVITRTKKDLRSGKTDIGVVASNEHETFPGALLLANNHLIDNDPDVLAVERAPITYTIDLPGLVSEGKGFIIVPTFSQFQSSTNKVLDTWFKNYSKDYDVVANFETDQSFAYSQEQLRVKFGIEFKDTVVESNIDFESVKDQKKLIMIYRFKQIFYTISVQSTIKPSDLFDCKMSLDELKGKVNDENPPVIVDSVSYGRTIYVKLETSSTDNSAKLTLDAQLSQAFAGTKDKIDFEKKLKDFTIQFFVIGGGNDLIGLIKAKTIEEVNDLIVRNSNFSRTNLGYPVSYSTQFIKDNSRAIVNMAAEYVETTRTIHKKGIVKIIHHGLYIAEWNVTWREISYNKEGDKVTKVRNWKRNGKKLTAPFEDEIELAGNTESIDVSCRYITGLAWEWWRTLIHRTGMDLIDLRVFKVSGTTLFPKHSITPDPDEGDGDTKSH